MNATLTDTRIESMRSTVMNAVDTDIRRRGTRTRRVVGFAAASVLVVGIGTAGISALQGPSTGGDTASSASAGSDAKGTFEGPAAGGGAVPLDESARTDADLAEREVIVTGSVNVTVTEPREAAQKVSAYVDSIGGRVDARTESGDDDHESALLQVRVPSTEVTDTITRLKTYGTVNDVTLQNDDVTTQAQDLDARIDALGISIKRLEKIMADATSSDELIKAEGALTQRQEQLESLESQRASIADQVQLSTLSIELTQKTTAEGVSSGGFKGGLVEGWNALVSTVNNVVEFVGVLLPWAAILVVLYGAYRLVARRRDWN